MKASKLFAAGALVLFAVAGFACGGEDRNLTDDEINRLAEVLVTNESATADSTAKPEQTQPTKPSAKAQPTSVPTTPKPTKVPPTKVVPEAPAAPDTVNGLNWRSCPQECTFSGEAAIGAFIRLTDGRECSGDEVTPCYVTQASGTVYGGAVNPYKGEVNGKSWKATFAYPAPPPTAEPERSVCNTIGCGPRTAINAATPVKVNAAFRGAYIKRPDGRECIKEDKPGSLDCYIDNANGSVVAGGVLYPFDQEYLPESNRQPFK